MPIPNVVALMPPTVRLPRPPPIPRPEPAMMPSPIPLPPAQFDHPYTGKLTILKPDDYALIRVVCSDAADPIACAFRTYDTTTGETLACVIMLGPAAQNDERALRHEIGHCNGWRHD
jgi:hypothetical protein